MLFEKKFLNFFHTVTQDKTEKHKIFFIYFFDVHSLFEADSFINFGSKSE